MGGFNKNLLRDKRSMGQKNSSIKKVLISKQITAETILSSELVKELLQEISESGVLHQRKAKKIISALLCELNVDIADKELSEIILSCSSGAKKHFFFRRVQKIGQQNSSSIGSFAIHGDKE